MDVDTYNTVLDNLKAAHYHLLTTVRNLTGSPNRSKEVEKLDWDLVIDLEESIRTLTSRREDYIDP